MFGNLDKLARHPRLRGHRRPHDRRSRLPAQPRLRPPAARRSTRRRSTQAATTLQRAGPRRATSSPASTALGYDDAWQQFGKGKGVFLIAGTWVTPTCRSDGQEPRLLPAAGARRRATRRSRSAARACRSRSSRSPRTRTSPRPTSTSSPTRTPTQVVAKTDNLPAMPVDPSAAPPTGLAGRHLRAVEDA